MRATFFPTAFATLTLAALLAAPAYSAAPPSPAKPETIIGARQAGFAFMAEIFGGMKDTVKSGAAPKKWSSAADEMGEWAALIPSLFPAGTEAGHDTKVLPAAFSDPDGLAARAADFAAASKVLKAAADANDAKAFASAFKQTATACGACHKTYRAKD